MNYRSVQLLITILTTFSYISLVSSTCSPCKTIQSCKFESVYTGSYLLSDDNSQYCPTSEGFTGCLYTKNGTGEQFCFKSGPTEQCNSLQGSSCNSFGATTPMVDNNPAILDVDGDEVSNLDINGDDEPILDIDGDAEPILDIDGDSEPILDIDNDEEPVFDIDTDDEFDINLKVPAVDTCHAKFPMLSEMSVDEVEGLCCEPSDCQDNAGCFQNELSPHFSSHCHCYLGYTLSNTTVTTLPMTGNCQPITDTPCDDSKECFTDSTYTVCPYCHVAREGEGVLGVYTSGHGDYKANDPMEFTGSSDSCATDNTGMYWYCWYDTMAEVVDLSHKELVIEEIDKCERFAYVYTPLACSFAQP